MRVTRTSARAALSKGLHVLSVAAFNQGSSDLRTYCLRSSSWTICAPPQILSNPSEIRVLLAGVATRVDYTA